MTDTERDELIGDALKIIAVIEARAEIKYPKRKPLEYTPTAVEWNRILEILAALSRLSAQPEPPNKTGDLTDWIWDVFTRSQASYTIDVPAVRRKIEEHVQSRLSASGQREERKTVKDILRRWLKDHGYAGLAGDDCGCSIDELAPCGCDPLDCVPADLYKCDVGHGQTCEYEQDCNGLGCYRPREPAAPMPELYEQHGRTCPKAPHNGEGYLHGKDDDSPYTVDGVNYCGRCHRVINAAPAPEKGEAKEIEMAPCNTCRYYSDKYDGICEACCLPDEDYYSNYKPAAPAPEKSEKE
jgi:hypothetical protein